MSSNDCPLTKAVVIAAVLGAAPMLPGCRGDAQPPANNPASTGANAAKHQHPTEGPHNGALIELGDDSYHAELLLDEQTGAVTIYVLDSSAREPVAIKADAVTINMTRQGEAVQASLVANPDEGDPSGKSSRFATTDAELAQELGHGGAQLVLNIAGRQYRGEIAAGHDHEH